VDFHREAQLTYQRAAALHESAAAFWERNGKPEKAAVERERAEWNRYQAGHEWIQQRVRLPADPQPS
jgi:hypothetical protein